MTKNKLPRIFLLLPIIFILQSCYGHKEFVNRTGYPATYKEYLGINTKAEAETVVGEIDPGRTIYYSMETSGRWTDERLRENLQDIYRIEIISVADTIALEGEEEIFNFHKERKAGLFKRKIKIVLE